MKYLLIIILSIAIVCNSKAQDTFLAFIESFPKYDSWKQLPEDIRDIKVSDKTLDADKLNLYIYSDKYQGEKLPTRDNKTVKPPARMSFDERFYFDGGEGKYANKAEISYIADKDTTVIIKYRINPLLRVHINDSICMVFLLYEGPSAEEYFPPQTNLYYEAYTFNIVREKVLSSLTLYKDATMLFSYIKESQYIYIYENYEYYINPDDSDAFITIARRTYLLRDDGFLQLTKNEFLDEDKKIADFTVTDPDGYTNVREQPTTQSKILYTIKKGFGGILEITDNPNWYRVIYTEKDGGGRYPGKNNYIKGWIHKSCICFNDGYYGWKKGQENVCK